MEPVLLGTVLPGSRRIDEENVNPTYKAAIQIATETTMGYFKLVDHRCTVVEAICAVLGRSMNLPIPRPMIVQVKHEVLPDVIPTGTTLVTFASQDAEFPSFKRILSTSTDSSDLWNKLASFDGVRAVAVFDEWIANVDRNQGNILFNGSGEFWFIDHDKAIPHDWPVDRPCRPNQLLSLLSHSMSNDSKRVLLREIVHQELRAVAAIDVDAAKSLTFTDSLLAHSEMRAIVTFLKQRAPLLSSLVATNIGVYDRELPYEIN